MTKLTEEIAESYRLKIAQAQLGHTDIRTTMKYNDMLSEHQARAANMLDYGVEKEKKPAGVVRINSTIL